MENVADAFLEDAGQTSGARSLDRSAGTKPGNSQIKFRVVGTALGAHTYDQASLFCEIGDVVITAATYVLATVTPSVSRFNNASVARFVAYNPMALRNLNFVGANDADALASIQVQPTRVTPFGQAESDQIDASSFQTAKDFQTTRLQIPIAEIVDGFTYLRIINDAKAVAFAYTLTATFGPRLDRRLEVPSASAAIVKSSAG